MVLGHTNLCELFFVSRRKALGCTRVPRQCCTCTWPSHGTRPARPQTSTSLGWPTLSQPILTGVGASWSHRNSSLSVFKGSQGSQRPIQNNLLHAHCVGWYLNSWTNTPEKCQKLFQASVWLNETDEETYQRNSEQLPVVCWHVQCFHLSRAKAEIASLFVGELGWSFTLPWLIL